MSELTAGEILRNQWKDGPRHHESELLDQIAGEIYVKRYPSAGTSQQSAEIAYECAAAFIAARSKLAGGE